MSEIVRRKSKLLEGPLTWDLRSHSVCSSAPYACWAGHTDERAARLKQGGYVGGMFKPSVKGNRV